MHIGFIDPFNSISGAKEAFVVKCAFGFFVVAPVTWRDVGAAITDFGFAAHVHQFELQPRRGHAQVACRHIGVGHKNAEGARLGHAKPGSHHNALANFSLLRFIQAVPNGLRQGGTSVEKHLHA